MLAASPDQLSLLTGTERLLFSVGDLFARRFRRASAIWNRVVMCGLVWAATRGRLRTHGLEHLAHLGPEDRVILVANHRSFFDFFCIGTVLYTRSGASRQVLFPVRSGFFYDSIVGAIINLLMTGYTMFPPILREKDRLDFNRYAVERCIAELELPGRVMGLHPEGTRNTEDDPYTFLRAQPGVGKIVLEAKGTTVIPVFICGLSNSLATEFAQSWWRGGPNVDIVFGPAIDLDDLRAKKSRAATQLMTSRRCMQAITETADEHRRWA